MADVVRANQQAKMSKSGSAGSASRRDDVAKPKNFWQRNALSLACLVLFLAFWAGQAVTGWHVHNEDAEAHGQEVVTFAQYLTTGHFFEATFENWESEFLQMFGFILLTAWFLQKGSAESKKEKDDPSDEDPWQHQHDPNAPWPVRRGGLWLTLYENSMLLGFIVLFILSIVGHAIAGVAEHNSEQLAHGQETVSLLQFAWSSDFWFQSFQNWQSEFLAVFSIVVLSIFLRQKGSSESKPVHAPHSQTGSS
jgi:hypothetical protein